MFPWGAENRVQAPFSITARVHMGKWINSLFHKSPVLGIEKNICRNIVQKQYNLDYLWLRKLQTLWNIRTMSHNYFKMALYLLIRKKFSPWNWLVVLLLLSASTLHPNYGQRGVWPGNICTILLPRPAVYAKADICTDSHLVPCQRFPVGFLPLMSSFRINFSRLQPDEHSWSSEGITSPWNI